MMDDCWIWTAHRQNKGYGWVWWSGRKRLAHRVIYETLVGPIPAGLELDHLCRNRACYNPRHLELVTHAENCRRGLAGSRQRAITHCPSGHPYAGRNLYTSPGGKRFCRECGNASHRRAYAAKKEQAA